MKVMKKIKKNCFKK